MNIRKFFNNKLMIYLLATALSVITAFIVLLISLNLDVRIGGGLDPRRIALTSLLYVSLICEVVFIVLSSVERRKVQTQLQSQKGVKNKLPGVVRFFSSIEAIVADVLLIVSTITMLVLICLRIEYGALLKASILIVFLSVNFNSILNGRNYRALKETLIKKKER